MPIPVPAISLSLPPLLPSLSLSLSLSLSFSLCCRYIASMRAARIRHDIASCDIISVSGIHDQRYKAARRYDRYGRGPKGASGYVEINDCSPPIPSRNSSLHPPPPLWQGSAVAIAGPPDGPGGPPSTERGYVTCRNSESLIDMAADFRPAVLAAPGAGRKCATRNRAEWWTRRDDGIHARGPARGTESGQFPNSARLISPLSSSSSPNANAVRMP